MIILDNKILNVCINELGAEIQSIKKDGQEYLWHGDEEVWKGRAPLLFPICGGLKDDKYVYEGKEYTLLKHGYARFCKFEVEKVSDTSATFLLKSNEESLKQFPFDYELRVSYVLENSSIMVYYDVTNKSDKKMYFSIGAHEGYLCPEGIEEYSLEFSKEERLTHNELHGNLLSENVTVLGENITSLPLKYEYFDVDALTFLNLKSREITLRHKEGKRKLEISFDGFDYVFVWTIAGKKGKYICIEPWCGIPDFEGSSYDITEKRGINIIDKDETFKRCHTITIKD